MKKAIATERVYNIFRQLIAIKYHYKDGTVRTVQMPLKKGRHKNNKG